MTLPPSPPAPLGARAVGRPGALRRGFLCDRERFFFYFYISPRGRGVEQGLCLLFYRACGATSCALCGTSWASAMDDVGLCHHRALFSGLIVVRSIVYRFEIKDGVWGAKAYHNRALNCDGRMRVCGGLSGCCGWVLSERCHRLWCWSPGAIQRKVHKRTTWCGVCL